MKALASPFAVAVATALVVVLLAPPTIAQNADAENQLDAIVKNGKLRVCTTGDYKPFTFHDKTANNYLGIDVDLAKSLASSLGVEAEFVATTWKTLLPDFTAGNCDIAMGGISVTLERQKQVFFSEPYLVNGKAPIARCEDEAKFQTIADIDKPDVTVIVNPGGTNEKFVREKLSDAKVEIYPDNVTIFQQILDGKADVMIAESVETELQEKLHPGLCAINPEKPLQYGEMGYMLPEGDVVFKAYVDQWIHLAKATVSSTASTTLTSSSVHRSLLTEMYPDEMAEFLPIVQRLRPQQQLRLGIECVYYFYNEDTSHHFHLWMVPRYPWMMQFGKSIEAVRPALLHARDNMNSERDLFAVASAVQTLRNGMKGS